MIECFLSEHAFYFSDGHRRHSYFHAKEDDTIWSAYSEYQRSYLMLLELLGTLKKDGIKDIIVYHNSRIIEEINGYIEPLDNWGRGALIYIRRNLLPYFVDYTFRKRSYERLIGGIADGKRLLAAYGENTDASKIITDIMKRRIQRFKNAGQKLRQKTRR